MHLFQCCIKQSAWCSKSTLNVHISGLHFYHLLFYCIILILFVALVLLPSYFSISYELCVDIRDFTQWSFSEECKWNNVTLVVYFLKSSKGSAWNQVEIQISTLVFWSGTSFCGYKARPVLSNEHGAVNSTLLHSSWQETVLEDNLFTRQEVIARLDLLAQPRKYQGWFLESLRGSRQLVTTENTSGEHTMVSVFGAAQHIQRYSEPSGE